MANRFDSQSKIRGCRQPVFVAHGTADRLVPFAQAPAIEAANEPKCFLAMEGIDHNDSLSRLLSNTSQVSRGIRQKRRAERSILADSLIGPAAIALKMKVRGPSESTALVRLKMVFPWG